MMQGFLIPNAQNQQPDANKKRQQIAEMIMGQPAQNMGEGLGQLMAGLSLRYDRQNSAFPPAPGGASPSFMTGLKNFFTMNNNGGLL